MAAQEWNGNSAGMGWEWHRNGMALECFFFLILQIQKWILTPILMDYDTECHRNGTGMAQERHSNGMEQEWDGPGNGAGLAQEVNGPGMAQEWHGNGAGIVQEWCRNGMAQEWQRNVTGMRKDGTGMAQEYIYTYMHISICPDVCI